MFDGACWMGRRRPWGVEHPAVDGIGDWIGALRPAVHVQWRPGVVVPLCVEKLGCGLSRRLHGGPSPYNSGALRRVVIVQWQRQNGASSYGLYVSRALGGGWKRFYAAVGNRVGAGGPPLPPRRRRGERRSETIVSPAFSGLGQLQANRGAAGGTTTSTSKAARGRRGPRASVWEAHHGRSRPTRAKP